MSDSREAILSKLRHTLQRDNRSSPEAMMESPLRQPVNGPQSTWKEADDSRFISKLEKAAGTISRVTAEADIIPAVTRYLQQHDIAPQLISARSSLLDKLAWPDEYAVERRQATGQDVSVLTEAYAGVAETGSLVLLSSADSPTSLNFLPDNYLCVLRSENLLRHIENVWQRLREEHAGLPRAINFITGPSRTADVEQTIQLGAHGPRRLHLILLESA